MGQEEAEGQSAKRGSLMHSGVSLPPPLSPLSLIIYSYMLEMQLIGKFHTPAARLRCSPAASHAVKVLTKRGEERKGEREREGANE